MFCFECGNKCSDNAVFCGYCGAKIIKVPNQGPDKAVTENVSRSVSENAETFVPVFESEGVMESDGFTDVDLAEEEKRIEEEVRKEVRRRMEEEKRLREQKHLEEQKKREEQRRIEEQRRLEEQKRIEEQRRLEEQKRIEEQKRLEEQRRIEKEKRRKEIEEQKKNIQIKRVELDEKRKKLNEELNSLDSEEKELAAKERGLEHKLKEASENIHDDLDEQKSQDVFAAQHDSFSDDYWDGVEDKTTALDDEWSEVAGKNVTSDDSRDEVDEKATVSDDSWNKMDENENYDIHAGRFDNTSKNKTDNNVGKSKPEHSTSEQDKKDKITTYVCFLAAAIFVIFIGALLYKSADVNTTYLKGDEISYADNVSEGGSTLSNACGDYYNVFVKKNAVTLLHNNDVMMDSFKPGYVMEIVYSSDDKKILLWMIDSEGQAHTIKPDKKIKVYGDGFQRAYFSFEKVKECYGSDFIDDKEEHKVGIGISNKSDYMIKSVWVGRPY